MEGAQTGMLVPLAAQAHPFADQISKAGAKAQLIKKLRRESHGQEAPGVKRSIFNDMGCESVSHRGL
jgi:hypothetical protein